MRRALRGLKARPALQDLKELLEQQVLPALLVLQGLRVTTPMRWRLPRGLWARGRSGWPRWSGPRAPRDPLARLVPLALQVLLALLVLLVRRARRVRKV